MTGTLFYDRGSSDSHLLVQALSVIIRVVLKLSTCEGINVFRCTAGLLRHPLCVSESYAARVNMPQLDRLGIHSS